MHLFNKQLILSFIIAFAGTQSVHASLAAAIDSQVIAQPVSLAQTSGQSQAPALSLPQAAEQAKPSTVALHYHRDEASGIRFLEVAPFTPKEIDRYPGYEGAFAEHAASHLESENPADIAAIAHLVHAYPEIAARLAAEAPNRKTVHKDIKKALATSKRPPIMTVDKAVAIAKAAPANSAMWHLIWGYRKASTDATQAIKHTEVFFGERKLSAFQFDNEVFISKMKALRASQDQTNAEILSSFGNDVLKTVKTAPKAVVLGLPRAIPVGIGTAALMHVTLREFDERVGDPFPCPKYDPKSKNVAYHSCVYAKWALRNVVVPWALSNFVVAPIYDKTTSSIKDLAAQQIDFSSNIDSDGSFI